MGSYRFGDDLMQDRVGEPDEFRPADAGTEDEAAQARDAGSADEEVALEELEMEDSPALADLIRDRLAADGRSEEMPREKKPVTGGSGAARIPAAAENWKLTGAQCRERLRREGVSFSEPGFATPGVGTPLMLDGPIGGVTIAPNWPLKNRQNGVMDCHLALALVELAAEARARGVKEIKFYSTYRPLKAPPESCPRGRKGSRCRRLKRAHKKSARKPSQHRAALAIDIRWFVTEKGETIDVLEDYDRRSGREPCGYEARGEKARLLQQFACALHEKRIFNVMLTPNANKAHHNHFHFDITPDAGWYIIR